MPFQTSRIDEEDEVLYAEARTYNEKESPGDAFILLEELHKERGKVKLLREISAALADALHQAKRKVNEECSVDCKEYYAFSFNRNSCLCGAKSRNKNGEYINKQINEVIDRYLLVTKETEDDS